MNESRATEQVKAIGQSAEVKTVYRVLSARVAIFSGVLAVGTGIYQIWRGQHGGVLQGNTFYWDWVKVLIAVAAFGVVLLWSKTKGTGNPFWSTGMRRVVLAFTPAMLAGAVVSYEMVSGYDEYELCALIWVLFYGVALLAVRQVVPRALRGPGWIFLISGLVITLVWRRYGAALAPQLGVGEAETAAAIMVVTFGLLHLLHGAFVLLGKGSDDKVYSRQ
jgi:hypothetical protein